MLDLGLSKLAVIGVVALVVIGPERLPRVARTAGALLGRAQRYINDVKSEVTREMELDEFRSMKSKFEQSAQDFNQSMNDGLRRHEDELNDAWRAGTHVDGVDPAPETAIDHAPPGETLADFGTVHRHTPPKRSKTANWRQRQGALPGWYKRANAKRSRVQSGAARVASIARRGGDNAERRTSFF
ncbi:Sec-independent protein translocase protein TatB [Chitinasiproducens palmae]|uniref:Sec-independent protein translocase protein TatB n=1 Tax=Chitinasiproducens palmae TaxID=1770053 RepID=A0A1H2PVF9_9BURK|nr:Sec-independent protein translocase protein TatB [Chitinasiproducens palmae]SDV51270.1 sec-independent protein translocase protein TatB [Chitinasiproducens palmae]